MDETGAWEREKAMIAERSATISAPCAPHARRVGEMMTHPIDAACHEQSAVDGDE